MLYLSYFAATHSASFLLAIFIPFAVTLGFFAFPWGRDQPTEIWALAKIRFLIKPRRRIWDQSGVKDLVTITAPKQLHVDYTNGLSETEVRSRLHALADTIDSRGWAIKNANLNAYSQPGLMIAEPDSDRLINPAALPRPISEVDIRADDDILDEKNNARAQAVDSMIEASAKAHREQIIENLKNNPKAEPPSAAAPGGAASRTGQAANGATPANPQYKANNYWFLNQPSRATDIPANMVTFNTQVVTPGAPTMPAAAPAAPAQTMPQDEASLMQTLNAKRQQMPTTAYYSHLHTIQPLSSQPAGGAAPAAPGSITQAVANGMPVPGATQVPSIATQQPAAQPPVTPTSQAAILQLAKNNDFNVATLAREADREAPDEVVIKLH